MKFVPYGSTRHYLSIPQVVPQDLSLVKLSQAAKGVKEFWLNPDQSEISPDQAAVTFYTLNHLASLVQREFHPLEPLPEWAALVMEAYAKCLVEQGQRMFSYLLLITTRESRHLDTSTLGYAWWSHFTGTYGHEAKSWNQAISGGNSIEVAKKLCNTPPNMALGKYVGSLSHLFHQGSFGSSFGGGPWGKIADCLLQCVEGKTSLEVMVDGAYSLAHNNGPIFNKGMLYDGYGNEFLKILDVQRSGQMPELVRTVAVSGNYITQPVADLVQLVQAKLPNAFGAVVDWFKVEGLGSVAKYPDEKSAQVAKGHKSAWSQKGNITEKGQFFVLPGVSVKQYDREAA